MQRILVWDLPTRFFHWLLAAAFIAAFVIANVTGQRDAAFGFHMIVGFAMGLMVVLRIIWGFAGSRWARFGTFVFGPRAVLAYFKHAFTPGAERHVGHNPGSSVAIFAMLFLTLGLVATGVLKVTGVRIAGDVHSILAYLLLAAAIAHVLGVIVHTWRQRENLAAGMVTGRKEGEPANAIRGAHPLVAIVFLVLTGLWSWQLATGYDTATRRLTLPLIGVTLQLGKTQPARPGPATPALPPEAH